MDGQHDGDEPGAGIGTIIALFVEACALFTQALERTDNLLDATDFTGVLHMLALTAGRVRALGEVLTLLTGSPEWTRQADEVLSDYMQPATNPEVEEQ